MRPIVLFLTVWLPTAALAMDLGGIPTPATRMQRGVTCTFAAGQPPRCSDGRLITTTRSTPVPCEQQQGVWTDVAANVACVTWDGRLEAHYATTNSVTNPADLSAASWVKTSVSVAAQGGGHKVTSTIGTGGANISSNSVAVASGETWTVACEMRNWTGGTKQLRPFTNGTPGVSACNLTTTAEWARYSCTNTATGAGAAVVPIALGAMESVEVRQCQLTKAATAGRRCDAASCDTDTHTMPAAGMPVASGEVTVSFAPGWTTPPAQAFLLDTRTSSGGDGYAMYFGAGGYSCMVRNAAGTITASAPGLPWVQDQLYGLRCDWDITGVRIYRDGALVGDAGNAPFVPASLAAAARIGGTPYVVGGASASGGIGGVRFRPKPQRSGMRVAALGDSLTHGLPYTPTPYPTQLQSQIGSGYIVLQHGYNGWRTDQVRSLWTSYARSQAPRVVVVLAGLNDVIQDKTAAVAFGNLSAIYSEAISDGATVVAVTVLPYGNNAGWTSARQAVLDALNASIRAASGVRVVDGYAQMAEPGQPTKLRASYDYGDGAHLTDAGAAALAALVAGAIQ